MALRLLKLRLDIIHAYNTDQSGEYPSANRTHTIYNVSSITGTALSLASSIEWDDRKEKLFTGSGRVRSEGVVSLSDIGTVGTEDSCWVVLICHIVDEDRVPDIRIHTSHREWRTP